MIQHPLRFFFLIRHSTPSLWYNIRIVSSCWYVTVQRLWYNVLVVSSCWYVTVRRHYDTTSSSFRHADTSQYAVTMIQRPRRFFLLIRHSTPSLWYNVLVVSSVWYVTVRHQFDTKLASFLLANMSQYAVTLIQRRGRFFCLIRHSTASLWYNVLVESSCWYVTVRRHYDTTSGSFLLSDTS